MRSSRVVTPSLLVVAAVSLAGCATTSSDNALPEKKGRRTVPCTATVLNIRQDYDGKNSITYDLRYTVSVAGRAPYEDTQKIKLTVIQVAQIVAVTKTYPCRVSPEDPNWVKVNWNKPIKSPSPKAPTQSPTKKAKPTLPSN